MLKLKHVLKALLDWILARPKADWVRKLIKVTNPIRLNVASFSGDGERIDFFPSDMPYTFVDQPCTDVSML